MLFGFARIVFLNTTGLFAAVILAGCTLLDTGEAPVMDVSPAMLADASDVMAGICFESAFDAANQTFVLRSDSELAAFFDLADNSELCARTVRRGTFDFASGQVLAGIWSTGNGCTALHNITGVLRDSTTRTIDITAALVIDGTCPYELVRPLWLAVPDAHDYDIRITVEPAAPAPTPAPPTG
jgi:hypothetical protein